MKSGPVSSQRGPGRRTLPALAILLLAAAPMQINAGTEWLFGGHVKAQSTYIHYPADSLFNDAFGSGSLGNGLETRLKVSATRDHWDFDLAYQFIGLYADTLALADRFPDSALPVSKVISDDRRWWNLTYSAGNGDKTAIINRLDRLSIGYSTEQTVWKFGRQAISWGNGLIFTPMDIFNPFDPAAVDKEYKTGDDMLYSQYLFDSGNDLQGVMVIRRNPRTGDVEYDQSSLALKYHGFMGNNEFDLLAAQHYGDTVLGLGGIATLGGAIWRGDITWTDTGLENVFSAATSLSYSWNWGGKNISGVLEYYYCGFGQTGGAYSIDDLLHNPELAVRLDRGELYTLARHYLAASAMIEVSPLFRVTPNVFINLEDPSALAQLVVQYDWQQNLVLLGSLNLPIGPDGSEYGGTVSPVNGLDFSTGLSLFAQVAWYF